MATGVERVEELRLLLGLSQNQFTLRINLKARSTYTMWLSKQTPDKATAQTIADRWQVSDDSLRGRPGTESIEPSPQLRAVQSHLLLSFSQSDTTGTTSTRLQLLHDYLATNLPELPFDAWLDWLQWTETEWTAMLEGRLEPSETQLYGAAFVAGWYHGRSMWFRWLSNGQAGELEGASRREVERMAALLLQKRDYVEWRRILAR